MLFHRVHARNQRWSHSPIAGSLLIDIGFVEENPNGECGVKECWQSSWSRLIGADRSQRPYIIETMYSYTLPM